ncbi:hypothetical protein OM076_30790 [Solirubrobacter ginsenosidimutans]|uniref:Uncharacterized protein n=1 Tax=Solirubrobacter ginsenosidimutans TaxID=490573 RepID=A0A9X3MXQ4_9ACTN|nr:hypothetical protein [Solirubrobacter ginsenosidimutans]MDA0164695.1 hypothetical protein [Solirubrobacter ginsenosidimutans]
MSSADPRGEAPADEARPVGAADGEPRPDDTADGTARRDAAGAARPDDTDDVPATRDAAGAAPGRAGATPTGATADRDAMARGYARSRAKTEAIQAQLQPLGPDERPLGLKLATALALFIAAINLIAAALGAGGESPATGFAFAILMVAVAAGLWTRRYLVILLFQALLALSIIVSTLSLAFAGNLLAVLLALAVIGACSPVFWLLVRVMARLQVPRE